MELGGFAVMELIGEGGAARVFRAVHETSGQQVAIKLFRHELLAQQELLERFHGEIRLLEAFEHPNLLACLAAGEQDGVPWFATQLCASSLASRVMREGRADPPTLVGYALEVLDGLDYLHRRGVVHRDVKPDNILLDKDDVAVLGDFGIAMDPAYRPTQLGAVMGTPSFTPPEQLDDPTTATPSSDLFSLGSSLFACCTLRSAMPLFVKRLREDALARLPEGLREVVARATHPDPSARFATAEAMARDLADLT